MTAKPRLRVSDHALRRYMERVMGLDFSDIEAMILKTVEPAYLAGAVRISAGGFTYHVRQNTVATIDASHSPTASLHRGAAHSGVKVRNLPPGWKPPKGARKRPDDDESWRDDLETTP